MENKPKNKKPETVKGKKHVAKQFEFDEFCQQRVGCMCKECAASYNGGWLPGYGPEGREKI